METGGTSNQCTISIRIVHSNATLVLVVISAITTADTICA